MHTKGHQQLNVKLEAACLSYAQGAPSVCTSHTARPSKTPQPSSAFLGTTVCTRQAHTKPTPHQHHTHAMCFRSAGTTRHSNRTLTHLSAPEPLAPSLNAQPQQLSFQHPVAHTPSWLGCPNTTKSEGLTSGLPASHGIAQQTTTLPCSTPVCVAAKLPQAACYGAPHPVPRDSHRRLATGDRSSDRWCPASRSTIQIGF